MTGWHYKTAAELVRAIRDQTISSEALLDHFIARHDAHNAKINAIVATDFQAARARARMADTALAQGEIWGPLHGLPMTIKDALEVAELPATGGAPIYADHRPAIHAPAVQRIVDAGAVIFGKTNVPLLSADLQTYNDIYGTTNNPWNLNCGPGGSSGGAAAALAAGLTALELGSDIGGSIRTPAHLCGVFGHKPSYGLVPTHGHIPPPPGSFSEVDLSVVGPLARSAEDLALLLGIVAGPNKMQARGWRLDLPAPRTHHPKNLRVAVWTEDPFCETDAETVSLINQTAEALARAGARIDFAARPDFSLAESTEIYLMMLHAVIAAGMPGKIRANWEAVAKTLAPDDKSHRALQARGGSLSYADWAVWHERRERLRAHWAAFFETCDVVLAPALIRPAFPHDHEPDWYKRSVLVNDKPRDYFDLLIWAGLAVVAYLPATVAPLGVTRGGLPVGVQIIGPYLEDYTSIEAAKMIELLTGGFRAPPGY